METTANDVQEPDSAQAAPEQAQRVAEIISRGQRRRPGAVATVLFAGLSAIALWASFTPLDWGPLAWVALVPLLCLVRPAQRTRGMYLSVTLIGFAFWLVTLQWMRLGDATMYVALLALSGYLALYWPVFLWLCRTAVHRWQVPMSIAAPVIWTGLEYLRAHLMTGFAWYLVGHSQYRWVNLIQVSDLFGAYGVSFLVVLANASLAQLIPAGFLQRRHLCWPSEVELIATPKRAGQGIAVAVSLFLVLLTSGYGWWRRGGEPFPRGPRVSLIQGNFVASIPDKNDPRHVYMMHRQLTGLTVSERPDLVVWPEGMFPYFLYEVPSEFDDEQLAKVPFPATVETWRSGESQIALTDLADMVDAALIIGLTAIVAQPDDYELFNSAAMFQPGVGLTNRYDKIHRVPFGEYIPLRDALPFLQSLTPFRGKFGIDQGKQAHVFRYRDWQLIPLICFEDTVPHLVRRIAHSTKINSGPQNQVLVNLTNDGWFHGSSELDQHLITSQFRAVETRTPLIRAVNTGISAVIDGDGVVCEPVRFFDAGPFDEGNERPRTSMRDPETGHFHKQLNCAIVADVPLDPRTSLYVFWGDWFAAMCLAGCLAVALAGIFLRWRPTDERKAA